MTSNQYTDNAIQVVDFKSFLDGTNKQDVADALLESLKSTGFVYLLNHGLNQEKIDEMFKLSKTFFDLPLDEKMLAPHPPSGTHHRGYSSPGLEKVSQHMYTDSEIQQVRLITDVKESFEVGRENDELMPNIWLPEEILPGFKDGCLQFFWDCFDIEKTLLKALAIGFRLPEDYFLDFHIKPDNQLRLLHYPSLPAVSLQNETSSRIDAHSDFGSMTLLFQDEVGGLEIQDPNSKQFVSVPPIPGSLLLNAGDLLMHWSNDSIKSAIHRVRAPPNISQNHTHMVPERYSIPYFCCVDFETVIDCIPGTWNEKIPKKYTPISAREYVMKRLSASY